jgi:hypothetical protein
VGTCTIWAAELGAEIIALEPAPAGAGGRPVAELPVGYGYRFCRPDAAGRLIPVADPGLALIASPARYREVLFRDCRTSDCRTSTNPRALLPDAGIYLQPGS